MDSLTLFRHIFKTPCEAICIFLDFFTEKRGSHREIYDFFRKSHETHCICRKFSIYCNKNCSGNMRVLCPFAETTYTPPGDENVFVQLFVIKIIETTYTPPGDENPRGTRQFGAVRRNNLHPARGRKPHALVIQIIHHMKQLTPRQGTKTFAGISQADVMSRNNLRPVRGRKHVVGSTIRVGQMKQLTPRQGTKTSSLAIQRESFSETTYAPSGDENCDTQNVFFFIVCETTHTPLGDENRASALRPIFALRNNLHPVRGRKPDKPMTRHRPQRNNLHPARGRKRSSLFQFCHFFETTYTPSGDENCFNGSTSMSKAGKQLTPRQGTKTA